MRGLWLLLAVLAAVPESARALDPEPTPQAPAGVDDRALDPSEERPDRALPTATTEAEGLYVEFGRGIRLTGDDAAFTLDDARADPGARVRGAAR